jgi:hypothetical protein
MHPDKTPTQQIPVVIETGDQFPSFRDYIQRASQVWEPPRRPWRRPLCWVQLGHFYHPEASRCLECGKQRPSS